MTDEEDIEIIMPTLITKYVGKIRKIGLKDIPLASGKKAIKLEVVRLTHTTKHLHTLKR